MFACFIGEIGNAAIVLLHIRRLVSFEYFATTCFLNSATIKRETYKRRQIIFDQDNQLSHISSNLLHFGLEAQVLIA